MNPRQWHSEVKRNNLVVIESVYSMGGDLATLSEVLDLALTYHSCVIVVEVHDIGVFGEME